MKLYVYPVKGVMPGAVGGAAHCGSTARQ